MVARPTEGTIRSLRDRDSARALEPPRRAQSYGHLVPHMPVSDAAADLQRVVEQAARTNVPVTLTYRGEKVAVLLSAEVFDYVLAATATDRTVQRLLRRRNADDVPDAELVRRELELD